MYPESSGKMLEVIMLLEEWLIKRQTYYDINDHERNMEAIESESELLDKIRNTASQLSEGERSNLVADLDQLKHTLSEAERNAQERAKGD